MEEQTATPEEGGASTLDRLERYLSAQESPPKQESAPPKGADEPNAEPEVEPDDDGVEQDSGPQLTTSDLARILGVEEDALDLDEDGSVKFRTKINGSEGAAKLAEMLKSYQLEGHVNKRSMEVAEKEKALQQRASEVEQQFKQRLEYAEGLANIAAHQLMEDFKSIPWAQIEAENPGQAALLRQKFQDKQAQLRGVYQNIEQNKRQAMEKHGAAMREQLAKEASRLVELIPEWKDEAVASKERSEIRDWGIKQGFTPEEMDSVGKAAIVVMLRKAMKHDQLQQKKPEIENRVRKAPVIVKPGQPAKDSQTQKLQNLRHQIVKSGGKRGIADYLIASGKV